MGRTATSINNGGSSPVAGLAVVGTLIVVLLVLAPQAVDIPMAAIGAILLMVVWKMAEIPHLIRLSKRAPRADIVLLWLTAALTMFISLEVAALVGVMLAGLYFMTRMATSMGTSPRGDEESRDEAEDGARASHVPAGTLVFDIDGPFFSIAIEPFAKAMADGAARPRNLIIRLDDAPYLDPTSVQAMEEAIAWLHQRGVRVIICDANDHVRAAMQSMGVVDLIGDENLPDSFADALALVRAA